MWVECASFRREKMVWMMMTPRMDGRVYTCADLLANRSSLWLERMRLISTSTHHATACRGECIR